MRGVHEPPQRTNSSPSISRPSRVVTARTCLLAARCATRHFGVPDEFHARRRKPVLHLGHEAIRREVTVLWKVDAAGDVHPDAGVERRRRFRVEHLRIDAQSATHFRGPDLLVERMAGPAQHQEPFSHEAEIAAGQRRQFLVAAVARFAQVAQQWRRAAHMLRRGRAPESIAPGEEVRRQPRLHVERRRRIPHPLEGEGHHAGRGERHEVARHEHSRVLERATVAPLRPLRSTSVTREPRRAQ